MTSIKSVFFFIVWLLCWDSLVGQERTIGILHNSDSSFEGYTLYAPVGYASTYLLDNCGSSVMEWESLYSTSLAAYLHEDGKLYRAARASGGNVFAAAGIGGVLERFAANGDLEWSVVVNTDSLGFHHDIHIMPNGNILGIAWERIGRESVIALGRDESVVGQDFWMPAIFEIKPIGSSQFEVVWEWHGMDHVVQDRDPNTPNFGSVKSHPELIDINLINSNSADWLHLNSVFYIQDRDQILLSSRHSDEIFIIDHSTTSAEASEHVGGDSGRGGDLLFRYGRPANYGAIDDQVLDAQHDAEMNEHGEILLFNNRTGDEASQIISIRPTFENGAYQFSTTYFLDEPVTYFLEEAEIDFSSSFMSSVQRLPNGNFLICSAEDSDLLEFDAEGLLVWRYRGPVSFLGPNSQGDMVAGLTFRTDRYAVDDERLLDIDLSVIDEQLELDPLGFDCGFVLSSFEVYEQQQWSCYMVGSDELFIQGPTGKFALSIFTKDGRQVFADQNVTSGRVDLIGLGAGLYFVTLQAEGKMHTTKTFIY